MGTLGVDSGTGFICIVNCWKEIKFVLVFYDLDTSVGGAYFFMNNFFECILNRMLKSMLHIKISV